MRTVSSQHLENWWRRIRDRLWLGSIVGSIGWGVSAVAVANDLTLSPSAVTAPAPITSHVPQPPNLSQQSAAGDEEEEEIEELETEVGDRDPTYLRTRAVVRYDRRLFGNFASSDRLRFRFLYAFGPKQRFAVSAVEPLIQTHTPVVTARGSGDAEAQFNANVFQRERFRAGVGVQTTLQTSSNALLGGATTTLRPSVELAGVPASRLELVAAFYYKRSIHTSRGIPVNQLEPDVIINARAFGTTWFLEWDAFYDVVPGRVAQTVKPGVSRAFGPDRRWVASAYYAMGVNDYARQSQYHDNAGIDVTWFPWRSR